MKIIAMLYTLSCNVCAPEPVAAYFSADGVSICKATAAAQNATEDKEYFCE